MHSFRVVWPEWVFVYYMGESRAYATARRVRLMCIRTPSWSANIVAQQPYQAIV